MSGGNSELSPLLLAGLVAAAWGWYFGWIWGWSSENRVFTITGFFPWTVPADTMVGIHHHSKKIIFMLEVEY